MLCFLICDILQMVYVILSRKGFVICVKSGKF